MNIIEKIKSIFRIKKLPLQNCKILPLGSYCFPRILTTHLKLKPSKKQGELTCPFDLAFFNNMDEIRTLIDTDFKDFFSKLYYDTNDNLYKNDSISAVFNHDGQLNTEEFAERYNARIKNFYHYINDKKPVVFLWSGWQDRERERERERELEVLFESLLKARKGKPTYLVIINHNNRKNKFKLLSPNIITFYQKFYLSGSWANELNTPKGKKLCKQLNKKMIKSLKLFGLWQS